MNEEEKANLPCRIPNNVHTHHQEGGAVTPYSLVEAMPSDFLPKSTVWKRGRVTTVEIPNTTSTR